VKKYAPCACGCGVEICTIDSRGRSKRFIKGHWAKTKEGKEILLSAERKSTKGKWRKESNHCRTCRYRARTTTDHSVCAWEKIGCCAGMIDVVHVDGDFTNNSEENKLSLCRTHHRLLDNGRIDPINPVMPLFKIGKDGKRRYLKSPYWNTKKRGSK